MHTDTTPKEKPTGDGNPTAGNTDDAILLNKLQNIKAALIRFASWLAVIIRGLA